MVTVLAFRGGRWYVCKAEWEKLSTIHPLPGPRNTIAVSPTTPPLKKEAVEMPPKQSTLTQIHTYLQSTNTAHTLKDLEKVLPGVISGLPSMLVKDHLSALVDEGLLLVEKIGSGNWYWTFGSAATREKKNVLEKMLVEKEKLATAVVELREAVAAARQADGGETVGLIAQVEELQKIRNSLAAEIEERSCVVADDAEVLRGKVNVYVGIVPGMASGIRLLIAAR